jgi:glycosyltransferase involved in cell wall biosynthesis
LDFDHLVVLVNRMAEHASGAGEVAYDPRVVRENMQELFGTVGIWAPISQIVQRSMREDSRYPPPHGEVWTPIIDTKAWCAEPLRWRGAARRRPVIGRHGRDHDTKWPSSADALLNAYCASKPCDVVLMGGATHALNVIGRQPRNWTVRREGAREPRAFLSGLDFYVHYPSSEDSGRAPIEAMAAGVPVILPPAFQETFGTAVLYAEPEAVWDTIQDLWCDEQAYLARARGGRDFVLQHCGYDQLVKRLENLSEKNRRNLAANVG